MELWVDFERVDHVRQSTKQTPAETASNLMIGRANSDATGGSFSDVSIDEMEIMYGDRDRLKRFYFIQRGPGTCVQIC